MCGREFVSGPVTHNFRTVLTFYSKLNLHVNYPLCKDDSLLFGGHWVKCQAPELLSSTDDFSNKRLSKVGLKMFGPTITLTLTNWHIWCV